MPVDSDHPCLIIYTSGTTGRPKGTVLTHGGFLLKCAHDFAYCHDVGDDDRLFWLTDLGWLMGPMLFTAALALGGTAVVFEGVPDYPKPDRLWALVERHKITVMGMSPTATRGFGLNSVSSRRRVPVPPQRMGVRPRDWISETAARASTANFAASNGSARSITSIK